MSPRHAAPLERFLLSEGFDGEVFPHEPMSMHTTYRIGGPARYYVRVDSLGALTRLIDICQQEGVMWAIVGRGSNLLVSDDGYDGVLVTLGRDFKSFRICGENNDHIVSGAGVLLSAVVQEAFKRSLAGLEFAVGTPGNIGGACAMNAGSAADWIGSRIANITTFSPEHGMMRKAGTEIEWGYRRASFAPDEIVLECELALEQADPFYIRGKMEANLARRKDTQPLGEPSCGSVFRNPEGNSAAKLIDECGLKGTVCGGAQISTKHANFFVNKGDATAADVRNLIEMTKRRVMDAYGIKLETEVRFLGF